MGVVLTCWELAGEECDLLMWRDVQFRLTDGTMEDGPFPWSDFMVRIALKKEGKKTIYKTFM